MFMKKNRAEKIVVDQEQEWSEKELREKRKLVEILFHIKCAGGGGNAPPSGGKLSGK